MTVSFRSALACASLGVLLSAPALARSPAALSATVAVIPATTAGFIDIDLAGWKTYGGFGSALNPIVGFDIGAGSVVTGFSYSGLSFTANSDLPEWTSWLSDLTLSVNPTNGDTSTQFLDWSPSTIGGGGSETGLSGSWNGGSGQAGPFGAGVPFTAADGLIFVTVYDGFDDPFGDDGSVLDTTITAGTMRVFITPVPEPGTYGMMALGLLAIGAAMRQRQQVR